MQDAVVYFPWVRRAGDGLSEERGLQMGPAMCSVQQAEGKSMARRRNWGTSRTAGTPRESRTGPGFPAVQTSSFGFQLLLGFPHKTLRTCEDKDWIFLVYWSWASSQYLISVLKEGRNEFRGWAGHIACVSQSHQNVKPLWLTVAQPPSCFLTGDLAFCHVHLSTHYWGCPWGILLCKRE